MTSQEARFIFFFGTNVVVSGAIRAASLSVSGSALFDLTRSEVFASLASLMAKGHSSAGDEKHSRSRQTCRRGRLSSATWLLSSSVKLSDDGAVVAKNGLVYDVLVH